MVNDEFALIAFLLVPIACILAFAYVIYLYRKINAVELRDPKAKEIASAIRVGAMAFLRRQYTTIMVICLPVTGLIFLGFWLVFPTPGMDPMLNAVFASASFLVGTIASLLAGYISMDISTRANIASCQEAEKSIERSLRVGFDGGLVLGLSVVAMSLAGVTILYWIARLAIPDTVERAPLLIIGLGFGASFSALFAQLGGGIYTKASDMAADLVGKVEAGIPEDDPRNPAVIADLVGDMVGDCAGRGADLFESATAENIGAMIIALLFYHLFGIAGFVFPLILRAAGIFATLIGQRFVQMKDENEDPIKPMFRGLYVTTALAAIFFLVLTWFVLGLVDPLIGSSWIWLYLAALIGLVSSLFIGWITDYYTSHRYRPVKEIADASMSGYATNVLSGLSVGFESTAAPVIVLVACIVLSYWSGWNFAVELEAAAPGVFAITAYEGGIFGTALATMGMLATCGIILAMDGYGPISDNAGGITEMAGLGEDIRKRTDALDAVGNTTKALTKGYAIGSAALAAFLLFEAYLTILIENGYEQIFSPGVLPAFEGRPILTFADPILILGGLIGALAVFVFAGAAIKAVGKTAEELIQEVRRQFREIPGLLEGKEGVKADYSKGVDIATKNALKNMVRPGLVVFFAPLLTGFILGPEAAAGFLMFGTVAGILLALLLNTGGGAMDNAKKFVAESPDHGGKGSEAHKAAVVGDTVGDPFKDTAGPSIHVLIKLINNVVITFGGLFIAYNLLSMIGAF